MLPAANGKRTLPAPSAQRLVRSGAATSPAIELAGLSFGFPADRGRPPFAIEVERLVIQPGECFVLHGDSGSGKSTLFSLLSLNRSADPRTAQRFRFRGTNVIGLDDELLSAMRAWSIGFIFQGPALHDERSGLANVEEPLKRLHPRWPPAQRATLAREALGMFFADPDQLRRVAETSAGRLSGGERQRIGLARSIVHRPAVLFADEPTTGLDQVNVDTLRSMLVAVQAEGATVLLISHDLAFVEGLRASLEQRGLPCQTRWMRAGDSGRPHVHSLHEQPPFDAGAIFRLGSAWRREAAPCLRCGEPGPGPEAAICHCGFPRDARLRPCPGCGRTHGGDFCPGCRAPLFPLYGALGE